MEVMMEFYISRGIAAGSDPKGSIPIESLPYKHVYYRYSTLSTTNGNLAVMIPMEGDIKIIPEERIDIFYTSRLVTISQAMYETFFRLAHQRWLDARMNDKTLEPLFETVIEKKGK